jgi:hypothetical protein
MTFFGVYYAYLNIERKKRKLAEVSDIKFMTIYEKACEIHGKCPLQPHAKWALLGVNMLQIGPTRQLLVDAFHVEFQQNL